MAEEESKLLDPGPPWSGGSGSGDQVEHLEDILGFFSGEEGRRSGGDGQEVIVDDLGLMHVVSSSRLSPHPAHGTESTTTHAILHLIPGHQRHSACHSGSRVTSGSQEEEVAEYTEAPFQDE
ncbi:hypothetical protein ACFWZ7_24885 [Nocardiopsis alba]|uniref:hypothetical protein n=1 Tax=Nocardiopsis alba TaxID=53437 RepID=UPI00367224D3